MRKWWLGLLLLLIILIACIYIFIPSHFHIHRTATFNAPDGAVKRLLIDNSNHWDKWWPGTSDTSRKNPSLGSYSYKNSTYTISDIKYNSLTLSIHINGFQASGSLILMPGKTDSSYLQWDAEFLSPSNPFKKVQAWFAAKKLRNEMNAILDTAKSFFSSQQNIYGVDIMKASVTDSILLSTFAYSTGYPTTDLIYKLVDELNGYAASQSASITGLPMLNINYQDSGRYMTRVAIPVDRKLGSSGNISYKWMLGGGNILVAEVKGGPWNIERAFHQVENYVNDYQRVAPAISFLSLVTDRRAQPDSSKWITRIYYPVM
jgi:hypothetical protein